MLHAGNQPNVLLIGNSHAIGLRSILGTVLRQGQPNKISELQLAPGSKFLAERVARPAHSTA
jgi:hypothetical protein